MRKYLKNIEWALFRLAVLAVFIFCLQINNTAQVIPVRLSTTFPFITIAKNGITTTVTDGLTLSNTTPSTVSVTSQYPPVFKFCGGAWKSNATAADQVDCWRIGTRPTTGATTTTDTLFFSNSINGGSYTDRLTIGGTGGVTGGSSIFSNYLDAGGDGIILTSVPTITSGFSTTTPSIVGQASAFAVTIAATPGVTGTVAFNTTYQHIPSVSCTNTITANAVQAVPTTTTVVLNGVWIANDIIRCITIGY